MVMMTKTSQVEMTKLSRGADRVGLASPVAAELTVVHSK